MSDKLVVVSLRIGGFTLFVGDKETGVLSLDDRGGVAAVKDVNMTPSVMSP